MLHAVCLMLVGGFRYGYDWKRAETEKNLLRTHTTAVSSRMLYKLAQVKRKPQNANLKPQLQNGVRLLEGTGKESRQMDSRVLPEFSVQEALQIAVSIHRQGQSLLQCLFSAA